MKTTRIFCGLFAAIMVVVLLSACGADSTYDGLLPEETVPTPAQPQKPADPTFRSVVRQSIVVNPDTTVRSTTTAQLTNDSLITRELMFKLGMALEGPSYLVVMDPAATVYNGTTGAPQTTEGNWTLVGKDSLRNETCVSGFNFSYYQMQVTTVNTVGYTCIGGKWVPYLAATLSTTAHRFSSVWEEENVVREDSIYRREVTTNEFSVTAHWKGGERSFILSKVVIIDHFVGMVEKEEPEVTPTPTTVEADYYFEGLNRFLDANRVFREDTKSWSDAYLFEGESSYLIVLANYRVKNDKEEFISFETQSVSKEVCPPNKYNGVMYNAKDGKFYPGIVTINLSEKMWTVAAGPNGQKLWQSHTEHEAINSGIKNFQGNNTARCTPTIAVATTVKEVNGKKVISFTGKTSVHTVTKTVADASLKN